MDNASIIDDIAIETIEDLVDSRGSVLSSDKEKYLGNLRCYINKNKKLVVCAEDHDHHEWYCAQPLESIIKDMSNDNALLLYNLLKERFENESRN